MLGPRAFYALALLLIVGGVAAYTRDPDWNLPTGPKAARVVAPSGGQATAPGSTGAAATGGATSTSAQTAAPGPVGTSGGAVTGSTPPAGSKAASSGPAAPSRESATDTAAKPAGSKAADAKAAAPANARPAFRRLTADSRDSTASIETSKPNPTSAAGLLGDPADPSGGKAANGGRSTAAANSEADKTPSAGAEKADDTAKAPAVRVAKQTPAAAEGDADRRETGKKVRQAKSRPVAKSAARGHGERTKWAQHYSRSHRQPWERRAAMVARSGGYGYRPSPSYSSSCRLETRWAMTAVGYQPVWVRVCD